MRIDDSAFAGRAPSNREQTTAVVVHASWFFAPLMAPLAIWLFARWIGSPYARRHAALAFNAHATPAILGVIVGAINLLAGDDSSEASGAEALALVGTVLALCLGLGFILRTIEAIYAIIDSAMLRPTAYRLVAPILR